MTPTPKLDSALVPAVHALPTASATPVPAIYHTPQSSRLAAGERPSSSNSSTWPAIVTTAELLDISRFRGQPFLFAHAGRALFTSRTRDFVQHVV